MSQTALALIAIVSGIGVWMAWNVLGALRVWWRLRGARVVTCPETGKPAAVEFDRAHAAFTALLEPAPEARLRHCSRWADRGPCEQPCAAQAESPAAAAAAVVKCWSQHRSCTFCGKSLTADAWVSHHVAVSAEDGTTIEWPAVAPETLPQLLETAQAVCWNCHIAEAFRRQHPELVTDR